MEAQRHVLGRLGVAQIPAGDDVDEHVGGCRVEADAGDRVEELDAEVQRQIHERRHRVASLQAERRSPSARMTSGSVRPLSARVFWLEALKMAR